MRKKTLGPHSSAQTILDLLEVIPPDSWPADWHTWPAVQEALRHTAILFRDSLPPPTEAQMGKRKGIVTCGGGVKYFTSVWVLLKQLRVWGCELPVEVWYLGPDEMDPAMSRLCAELGAWTVDAREVARVVSWRILRGWELKPFAILHSRFREVIFLDADCTPAFDPDFLFDEEEYIRQGAIFWPDYPSWALPDYVWEVFGMEPGEQIRVEEGKSVEEYFGALRGGKGAPVESGQMVIDKGRCWRELRMAGWYAEHSDFVFRFVHGDKECFRLGWMRCGTAYAMPEKLPSWELHTMLQHDFQGRVLFLHRTQDKLRPDGKNRSSKVPGEALLFDMVGWLAQRFGGTPWQNDHPTTVEAVARAQLAGQILRYSRLGFDERVLELLPDGTIGRGNAKLERRYSVFEEHGRITLAICGDTGLSLMAILGAGPDPDVFYGRWIQHERMPVELEVLDPDEAGLVPSTDSSLPTGRIQGLPQDLRKEAEEPDSPGHSPDALAGHPGAGKRQVELPRKTRVVLPGLGIIMPVVLQVESLWEMTQNSVGLLKPFAQASRQMGREVRLHVVCNRLRNIPGLDLDSLQKRLVELCEMPVQVTLGDRSVAASWNEGIRQALGWGAERFLVMANDCFLKTNTIEQMLDIEWYLPVNCWIWSGTADDRGAAPHESGEGCDFTCFMLRPTTLSVVGWFDETFRPAYFEDNDYYVRVLRAGGCARMVRQAEFLHYGSATVRSDPEMAHHKNHWWEHNKSYYTRKWGLEAPPTNDLDILAGAYLHPFNDPSRPVWWWEGSPEPLQENKP